MIPRSSSPLEEKGVRRLIEELLIPAFEGMRRRWQNENNWSIFVRVKNDESLFKYIVGTSIGTATESNSYIEPACYDYSLGINQEFWLKVIDILENEKERYKICVKCYPEGEDTSKVFCFYQKAGM